MESANYATTIQLPAVADLATMDKTLEDSRLWRACVAGSCAGLVEHSTLYPIDTVKTRLQSVLHTNITGEPPYKGFIDCFQKILRYEKFSALFRGLPAVLAAAVPSHAAYFGSYEYVKHKLAVAPNTYEPAKTSLAACAATCAHDFIVTPFDVVKQRMQLKNCKYPNVCRCAIDTFRKDGYLSFYRSYPATVLLNIPVFVINFLTYETSKLTLGNFLQQEETSWYIHLFSGALAGGLAGFVSNPLDVVKTTIQTDPQSGYLSIPLTVSRLLRYDQSLGYKVLMSGVTARMLYMIPSAAITWTTYEGVKRVLGFPLYDLDLH